MMICLRILLIVSLQKTVGFLMQLAKISIYNHSVLTGEP